MRFTWSCQPKTENDTTIDLLWREIKILISKTSRVSGTFQFFERQVQEKSTKKPNTLKTKNVIVINFGNPQSQWTAKAGTLLLAGGSIAAGAAGAPALVTGAAISGFVTMAGYALQDSAYYSHEQCTDQTVEGIGKGMLTGGLGHFFGSLSVVGNLAAKVAEKLPLSAKTITTIMVAGGVSGACGTLGAISDWLNSQPAKNVSFHYRKLLKVK